MSREIEICEDKEWLELYGGLNLQENGIDLTFRDEVAGEYSASVYSMLINSKLFSESEWDFVSAKAQRSTCHGWHEARFTHKFGGLGTFENLTREQQEELFQIDCDAVERAPKAFSD